MRPRSIAVSAQHPVIHAGLVLSPIFAAISAKLTDPRSRAAASTVSSGRPRIRRSPYCAPGVQYLRSYSVRYGVRAEGASVMGGWYPQQTRALESPQTLGHGGESAQQRAVAFRPPHANLAHPTMPSRKVNGTCSGAKASCPRRRDLRGCSVRGDSNRRRAATPEAAAIARGPSADRQWATGSAQGENWFNGAMTALREARARGSTRSATEVSQMHREYWEEGLSLTQIGARWGMTRQGAQSLFKSRDLPIRSARQAREARRARHVHTGERRAGEIVGLWCDGRSTGEIARTLACPESIVREILASRVTKHDRRVRRARMRAGGREGVGLDVCVTAVQDVATHIGHPKVKLTADRYGLHRCFDGARRPSAATIAARFGWRYVMEAAGLVKPRQPVMGRARVSTRECIEALHRSRRDLGCRCNAAEYERWRKTVPGTPCLQTVTKRLGRDVFHRWVEGDLTLAAHLERSDPQRMLEAA